MRGRFNEWNKIKKKLHENRNLPTFNEREVWWCSIGMNIGFEIYGKGEEFWRPVLILQKHNPLTFFGLPLGSANRPDSPFHHPINVEDRDGSVLLTQGRTLSSKRLSNIIEKLPESKFEEIRLAFKNSF